MMVYVAGTEPGPVKVGSSKDPARRLRALQTGHDRHIHILDTVTPPEGSAKAVEGHAHWLLDHACTRGEWFAVTATEARAAVAAALIAVANGESMRSNGKVGRPKINHEQTPARFPLGTLAKIDAALKEGEARSDFIREAVEAELKRRAKP